MSETQERHSVSKLIGASSVTLDMSKVKWIQGQLLTSVEDNPIAYLLDEVEKVHQRSTTGIITSDGRWTINRCYR